MLNQLSIRNFAIIDDISVSFTDGLTVLTGETGAGKSIIIDAVQLLTGARASVDFIRHGENKAEIIGLFDISFHKEAIMKECQAYDIDLEADELFILERTLTDKGKSVCRVNGKIVTLSTLRTFGQMLVQIHSQHDHYHLLNAKFHLQLLDSYDPNTIDPLRKAYEEVYDQYEGYKKQYDELNQDEQQLAHRLDLLLFQQDEIMNAALEADEDNKLEKERVELQNYATVYRATATAYDLLNGDEKALELIDMAAKAFADPKLEETEWHKFASKLESLYFQLEEISFDIRNGQDQLFFDEDRLNEIESRLNVISQLKRKYGNNVNEIIAYQTEISKEIDQLQNREAHHEQLIKQLEDMQQKAIQAGNKLTKARKNVANKLIKQIKVELADLYLKDTIVEVAFSENKEQMMYRTGLDHVQFLLASNKGEPLKELSKVASGGELSRIMLALKKIFAKNDRIGTVIFDEIDTGVSGRVAEAIAEKMFDITKSNQVLCITHLAQVAAMSDQHLLIEKMKKGGRTTTSIQELSNERKIEEIGKMITGSQLTQSAIEHAEQLLQLMDNKKSS